MNLLFTLVKQVIPRSLQVTKQPQARNWTFQCSRWKLDNYSFDPSETGWCRWGLVKEQEGSFLDENQSNLALATSCEELACWKRLWCWEGLGAGGKGENRGWDGWMASPTRWTWVWVNSGRWWWTGRPGMLWFMGSQRVGHDWVTELNWTDI